MVARIALRSRAWRPQNTAARPSRRFVPIAERPKLNEAIDKLDWAAATERCERPDGGALRSSFPAQMTGAVVDASELVSSPPRRSRATGGDGPEQVHFPCSSFARSVW
jgi:hypothetical protein